jgi:hypothetical protein
MASEHQVVVKRGGAPDLSGMLWFTGWLFTIAFAKLIWWKALLGLIIWPYYLGTITCPIP